MTISHQITGAIVGLAVGVAAVLPATQRAAPVELTSMAVVTPVVAPGNDLRIRVTVNREKVCQTTSYVTLFDGANVEWRIAPVTRAAVGPAGEESYIVRHTVPAGATPGPARYRLVLDFVCNWTHRIAPVTLILPDLGFEIGNP